MVSGLFLKAKQKFCIYYCQPTRQPPCQPFKICDRVASFLQSLAEFGLIGSGLAELGFDVLGVAVLIQVEFVESD